MSPARSITFRCPHCEVSLNAKENAFGKEASCPKCKNMIVVPESDKAPARKVES